MLNFFQNLYQNIYQHFLTLSEIFDIWISPSFWKDLELQYFDKVITSIGYLLEKIIEPLGYSEYRIPNIYEIIIFYILILIPWIYVILMAYKHKKEKSYTLLFIILISIIYTAISILINSSLDFFQLSVYSMIRILYLSSIYGLFLIFKRLFFIKNNNESHPVIELENGINKDKIIIRIRKFLYNFFTSRNLIALIMFFFLSTLTLNIERFYGIKPISTVPFFFTYDLYIDQSMIFHNSKLSDDELKIISYDKYNFEKKWEKNIDKFNGEVTDNFYTDQNHIVIVNEDFNLTYLSKENGEKIREVKLKYDEISSSKNVYNTTFYIMNDLIVLKFVIDQKEFFDPNKWIVYYFDIKTGERILKTDGFTKMIYSYDNNAYFYKREYQQDLLYKLDLKSRETIILNKKSELKHLDQVLIELYKNQFLFASKEGDIYLLNESGEYIWKTSIPNASFDKKTPNDLKQSFFINEDSLFVISSSEKYDSKTFLNKLNLKNGLIEQKLDINRGVAVEVIANKYLLVIQKDQFDDELSLVTSKNSYMNVYKLEDLSFVKNFVLDTHDRYYDGCYRHTYISPNNELIFDCDSYFMRKFDLNFMLNDSFGKPWFFRIFD